MESVNQKQIRITIQNQSKTLKLTNRVKHVNFHKGSVAGCSEWIICKYYSAECEFSLILIPAHVHITIHKVKTDKFNTQ